MSTVSLPVSLVTRARDLFVLYANKNAFKIEEYVDAGSIYKRLVDATQNEETAEVSENDIKYIISAINVCAQRTPVEVQNYKPIAELLELLAQSLKSPDAEANEMKTDL